MSGNNDLGDFLRAHRGRLRPDDVGLPSYGARRVAGLRREEVAVLAGMNSDYYARLEQGRERSPSPQILEAISGALLLDDDARAHLFRLAGAVPERRRAVPRGSISPELRQLLDGLALGLILLVRPSGLWTSPHKEVRPHAAMAREA